MFGNRKFRILNMMDDCSREVLAIEIGTSMCLNRVIRILDKIIKLRGKSVVIQSDNGPEFTT